MLAIRSIGVCSLSTLLTVEAQHPSGSKRVISNGVRGGANVVHGHSLQQLGIDFVILAICGLDLRGGATLLEVKIRCYYTAPNRIGDKEAKILGITRGVDDPGSILVFLGHLLQANMLMR